MVLGGGVQRDHVEPLLGGDRVGGRVGARRDRHRLARRVVGDRHRPGERGGLLGKGGFLWRFVKNVFLVISVSQNATTPVQELCP